MYPATGPGKTEVDKTKYNRPGAIKALLYNFDFDDMASTTLKSEHANFLSTKASCRFWPRTAGTLDSRLGQQRGRQQLQQAVIAGPSEPRGGVSAGQRRQR